MFQDSPTNPLGGLVVNGCCFAIIRVVSGTHIGHLFAHLVPRPRPSMGPSADKDSWIIFFRITHYTFVVVSWMSVGDVCFSDSALRSRCFVLGGSGRYVRNRLGHAPYALRPQTYSQHCRFVSPKFPRKCQLNLHTMAWRVFSSKEDFHFYENGCKASVALHMLPKPSSQDGSPLMRRSTNRKKPTGSKA